ncbi:hypothetical protein IVB12_15700 [Bradyrhizobium sp. 179]|uniref:hypothetical protein n=1 Tax=Bradyrhizobium sp. 179 TaxID=2782648 RepID=UPI001FFAFD59|nr:hypothetical protein [Bradyrhizobium sp. 179]MCK1543360.1 hypothetical protein [Bradyrhizobium sp. 179]
MTGPNGQRRWRQQDLLYAREELRKASTNLWRARKIGYRPVLLRHCERLVCAALDHVWDIQEEIKELSR